MSKVFRALQTIFNLAKLTVYRTALLPILMLPILLSLSSCSTTDTPPPAVDAIAEQRALAEKARREELKRRQENIRKNLQAERVVIEKSKRLMTVFAMNKPIATYQIALGRNPVGQKQCAGDNRTPEGVYSVIERKENSNFYRALRLSYPLAADIERAKSKNCPPGGNIMIHGLENGFAYVGTAHRSVDWTNGCIAVTNEEMDQLWKLVRNGTIVEIRP
jgi:murein L,D-transpeptidase YafK